MRAFTLLNATKVLIAMLALVVSMTGFVDARDRHGDRNHDRRPHHRDRIDRDPSITGIHHHRRHGKKYILSSRNKYDRHAERRFAHDRRPNRRIIPREYRADNRNYWEPAYREDFPSYGTGGAYLGGLSAWRDPGNGTYFSSEHYGYDYGYQPYDGNGADRGHRAKIIHVNPSTTGRACSWESGVCVIRR